MIIHGDCLEEMRKMEDNFISCIVTDPPYGLGFMHKEWDAGLPHEDIWKEAIRICKPGSFLLAFGGTRTYHRLTCAIEDAGWEIRDCLQWIYGSGFPKSHNHFGIEGYGTALKPAYEPIIMAMKPCDGTFKQNAEKWGQAGINIDESRIPSEAWSRPSRPNMRGGNYCNSEEEPFPRENNKGRWPANVMFDEEAAEMLDKQAEVEASRFFYCAKASPCERDKGLDAMPDKQTHRLGAGIGEGSDPKAPSIGKNYHPTVKPLKLMQYLIKLVMPPLDGILLDPFAGSGSTILATKILGFNAIGIEKNADYCEIARTRIENYKPDKKESDLFDQVEKTA